MKMRPLGKTGIMVSEIGLGCEHLQGKPYEQIKSVLDAAEERGINAMDTFMSQMEVRRDIGRALKGRRERFIIQGHIGSVWTDGAVFLVNSRLGRFTAAPFLEHPFSLGYGVILQSSLAIVLSLTSGFSPCPCVSIFGTGRCVLC